MSRLAFLDCTHDWAMRARLAVWRCHMARPARLEADETGLWNWKPIAYNCYKGFLFLPGSSCLFEVPTRYTQKGEIPHDIVLAETSRETAVSRSSIESCSRGAFRVHGRASVSSQPSENWEAVVQTDRRCEAAYLLEKPNGRCPWEVNFFTTVYRSRLQQWNNKYGAFLLCCARTTYR
jgi:hypothetical protein